MQPLLNPSYWFSLTPVPMLPWVERVLLIVFATLFVAGIVTAVLSSRGGYAKLTRRAIGRAASHLAWTGFTGGLLWVFAYEQIPLLSMRAFYVVWAIWFIVGAWFIFQHVWKEIPAAEARNRERLEREKWLPKRRA